MFGRTDLNGHYYVDLYNVASGERVLAIQGEFHGVDPHHFFDKSAWISKRHFVLPLDDKNPRRRFIICDVQRASSTSESDRSTIERSTR